MRSPGDGMRKAMAGVVTPGAELRAARRPRRRSAGLALAALLAATACGDQAPPEGGTLTMEVRSPHGAEGAARVTLVGAGVRSVSAVDGWVYEQRGDTLTTVLVVNDEPGPLRFRVEVADTTVALRGTVDEVAGPDDALRSTLAGYSVSVVR